MKKILALLLAAVMLLAISGCTKPADKTPDEDTSKNDSVETVYMPAAADFVKDMQSKYGDDLPAMEELPEDVLDQFYAGLNDLSHEDMTVQEPMISAVGGAAAIIVLYADATQDDIDAATAIFQQRINDQIAGGAFYPSTVEAWENAIIATQGRAVGLFVCPENDMAKTLADEFRSAYDVTSNKLTSTVLVALKTAKPA